MNSKNYMKYRCSVWAKGKVLNITLTTALENVRKEVLC
jgi:hypothetical protein